MPHWFRDDGASCRTERIVAVQQSRRCLLVVAVLSAAACSCPAASFNSKLPSSHSLPPPLPPTVRFSPSVLLAPPAPPPASAGTLEVVSTYRTAARRSLMLFAQPVPPELALRPGESAAQPPSQTAVLGFELALTEAAPDVLGTCCTRRSPPNRSIHPPIPSICSLFPIPSIRLLPLRSLHLLFHPSTCAVSPSVCLSL